MELTRNIREAIETLVRERFRGNRILSVSIEEGDVFDDEAVIYVTVVFDAAQGLNTESAVSITRHTRDRLRAESRFAPFPVYRFMSGEDAKRVSAAVA